MKRTKAPIVDLTACLAACETGYTLITSRWDGELPPMPYVKAWIMGNYLCMKGPTRDTGLLMEDDPVNRAFEHGQELAIRKLRESLGYKREM